MMWSDVAMTFYAELPMRRMRQILGDLFFVFWVGLWIRLGMWLHDVALGLAKPGELTESAATALGDRLQGAGERMGEVPVVGGNVSVPFDQAAEASRSLAAAGRTQADAAVSFAWWPGLLVALTPILVAALYYLPKRWRFARTAAAGRRFVDATADLDLFALRAMAHQPLHVLARISDDPAGAWRNGDQQIIRELAELELAAVGMSAPVAPGTLEATG